MIDHIVSNSNYLTDLKYVSGRITEYDISAANINVLYKYGAISLEEYNYLISLPKHDREVDIGLRILHDKKFYEIICDGIEESRLYLAKANNIQPYEVIRIANDAMYINRFDDLKYTTIDNIVFKKKSVYNCMVNLCGTLIFESIDMNDNINVDVKGIGDSKVALHQNGFLAFIANVMYYVERISPKDALEYISDFSQCYLSRQLPTEYYREFDSLSMFKIADMNFKTSYCDDISKLDIGFNYFLIRELYSIVLQKANLGRR